MSKLTKEELKKRIDYYKKRIDFYEKKVDNLDKVKCKIGFRY